MGMCDSRESKDEERRRREKARSFKLKPVNNKNSFVKEDDIKALVIQNFDKYDRNGDGTLDLLELTEFFKDILKRKEVEGGRHSHYGPKELAASLIHRVDMDGDNRLTRE